MIIEKYVPVFSPEEEARIESEYQALIQDYLASNHRQKVEIIDKAFNLARVAHAGVRRRSGEPYILHPIAVARIICSEMGLGSTSICCALMHDVVEDTDYTVEDLEQVFGDKIAQIVDGLTKISGETFDASASLQAENFRKLLLTMSDDARVILIKIADRLHNMRTLGSMLPAKQYKIAGETQFIYAPLAHRFGLYAIKSELEDLSFKYEHPESYAYIGHLVQQSEADRQELFRRFSAPIEERLNAMGIKYEMRTRTKSNYSIWRKMQTKGIPFSEVYDLFAVRIIFDSYDGYPEKNRCFDIYTAITEIYRNRPDRMRDWLTTPKSNGYQALHLTVMGPDGKWIEVQIRSRRMDDIAEQGLAAHWRYKSSKVEEDKDLEKWLDTIREVLQEPSPDGMDFLDNVKLSLYANDITVFTPRGDSVRLPVGATVLDMAYSIHSELGDRCIGAKVNHRVATVSTKLSNGDQVEILDSKVAYAKKEWLDFVVTAKARLGISSALRKQMRELATKGEDMVRHRLDEAGIALTPSYLDKLINFFRYGKRDEFYRAVALGEVNLDVDFTKVLRGKKENQGLFDIVMRPFRGRKQTFDLIPEPENPLTAPTKIDKKKPYTLVEEDGRLNYILSPCCRPILGDDVLGVLDNNQVFVHKRACPVATRIKSSQGDRLLSTHWGDHGSHLFEATLFFRGVDTVGILHGITQTLLEDFKVNITSMNIKAKEGLFDGEVTVQVHNTDEVEQICQLLGRNGSILTIHRLATETTAKQTER